MPCYDKKLEASRSDFYNDIYSTRDVDCVITTGELEILIQERGWDLSIPVRNEEGVEVPAFNASLDSDAFPELLTHSGSSSGSYLQSLVTEYLTKDTELTTRTVRSADYEEYIVTKIGTGSIVFKGARCYGFRNLQNLVRKVGKDAGVQVGRGAAGRLAAMRAKKITANNANNASAIGNANRGYDYVEVMACPSGCINGGGQLKPRVSARSDAVAAPLGAVERDVDSLVTESDKGLAITDTSDLGGTPSAKWGDREWTKKVEQAYWHDLPTPPPSPSPVSSPLSLSLSTTTRTNSLSSHALADELAARVLTELCKPSDGFESTWQSKMDSAAEESRKAYFRTQYRAVESELAGIQVQW